MWVVRSNSLKCKNSNYVCKNGGKCVSTERTKGITVKCECLPGFKGSLCEKSKVEICYWQIIDFE